LRVGFAGTPPFAATALEALRAAGHEVPIVLTQPDRPAGRGMCVASSAVAETAKRMGLSVSKPQTLRDEAAQRELRDANIDVLVVAAYGLLLPAAVLEIPARGCLNIHASLLPRWRGAAPIQRAILAGDDRTGVTIMQMDAGLDTGPALLQESIPIRDLDTSGTLTALLAGLGARSIVRALDSLDRLQAVAQDNARATHAPKVSKAEAAIDWSQTAESLWRRVRAFNPAPGTETRFGEDVLKIWEARSLDMHGSPGQIVAADADRLVVACGNGALDLVRVQRAGGTPMSGPEFARGARLAVGTYFGSKTTVRPPQVAKPLK
jgi:methionyl-tRNA formyltransferase